MVESGFELWRSARHKQAPMRRSNQLSHDFFKLNIFYIFTLHALLDNTAIPFSSILGYMYNNVKPSLVQKSTYVKKERV